MLLLLSSLLLIWLDRLQRIHFILRNWWILLIRKTLTITLLYTFAWLWTGAPFTPIAPSYDKKNKNEIFLSKIYNFRNFKVSVWMAAFFQFILLSWKNPLVDLLMANVFCMHSKQFFSSLSSHFIAYSLFIQYLSSGMEKNEREKEIYTGWC